MEIVKPKPLKAGEKIGIAAPAGPFEVERFEKGLAVIGNMGFVPVADDDIYKRDRHMAGPDQQRARHLMRLFGNDDIKAIICARGGFGCLRVLPYLDYDVVRANPKMMIGFSDVTALLATLYKFCGLAGLHGPVVTSIGAADEASKERFHQLLTATGPAGLTSAEPVVIKPGQARGVMIGGNLATLCHLVGTPFAPDFKGKIVLLEDVNEAPYRLDRMLTQMRMAGCFKEAAGIVLGTFTGCGEVEDVRAVLEDIFAGFQGPVLGGFEIGHGKTNMAVPVGVEAKLDTDQKNLRFF